MLNVNFAKQVISSGTNFNQPDLKLYRAMYLTCHDVLVELFIYASRP